MNHRAIFTFIAMATILLPLDAMASPELTFAAYKGDFTSLKDLLQKGADINYRDENGYSALHWSALNGFNGMADYLLSRGANPNAKDTNGYTPLMLAASKGNRVLVVTLIKNGADWRLVSNEGHTAADFSIEFPELFSHFASLRIPGIRDTNSDGILNGIDWAKASKEDRLCYVYDNAIYKLALEMHIADASKVEKYLRDQQKIAGMFLEGAKRAEELLAITRNSPPSAKRLERILKYQKDIANSLQAARDCEKSARDSINRYKSRGERLNNSDPNIWVPEAKLILGNKEQQASRIADKLTQRIGEMFTDKKNAGVKVSYYFNSFWEEYRAKY